MVDRSGHPDWQSYAQWRSPTLVDSSGVIAGGGAVSLAGINASHWQSILVHAESNLIGIVLVLQTASDVSGGAAGWVTQGTYAIPPQAGKVFEYIVPLNSAFRFVVLNASGVAQCNYILQCWGANNAGLPGAAPVGNNFVAATSFSLANGTSKVLLAPYQGATRGNLLLTVPNATPAGFSATLWTVNELGALTDVVSAFRNITTTLNQAIVTPRNPLAWQLSNVTGGTVNGISGSLALAA